MWSNKDWSEYWAKGALHSCPSSFEGFYGDTTQAFWCHQIDMCGSGDTLVDLCCGNGGLLAFVAERLQSERTLDLVGVDSATLDAGVLRKLCRRYRNLRIFDQTAIENIPVADASVHLATSQFGVEYALDDLFWAELARILASSARAAWIVHHADSALISVATDELKLHRSMCEPGGVLELARQVIQAIGNVKPVEQRASFERIRRRYNDAVRCLLKLSGGFQNPHLVHDALRPLVDLIASATGTNLQISLSRFENLVRETRGHMSRLDAMCAAALDDMAIASVLERFSSMGLSPVAPSKIYESGQFMGVALAAGRGRLNHNSITIKQ